MFVCDDDFDDEVVIKKVFVKLGSKGCKVVDSEDEVEGDEEEEEDIGYWGFFKGDYYNVDNIEIEVDVFVEEVEVK